MHHDHTRVSEHFFFGTPPHPTGLGKQPMPLFQPTHKDTRTGYSTAKESRSSTSPSPSPPSLGTSSSSPEMQPGHNSRLPSLATNPKTGSSAAQAKPWHPRQAGEAATFMVVVKAGIDGELRLCLSTNPPSAFCMQPTSIYGKRLRSPCMCPQSRWAL